MSHFACVTWNIHRARGADGIVSARRIEAVLRETVLPLAPDLIVLQEADEETAPYAGLIDIAGVARDAGLVHVNGAYGLRWGDDSHGFTGVVCLLGAQFEVTKTALVDLPGYCPRGAIVVDAIANGTSLRLIATHLALSQLLRVAQMRTIGQFLARQERMQTILIGDLNEWRPWSGLAFGRAVAGHAFDGPAPMTFPAKRPFLPLDRIMTDRPDHVVDIDVLDSAAIRVASDHRPLFGRVRIGAPAAATFAGRPHLA